MARPHGRKPALPIKEAGGTPDVGRDPIALMKAIKNATEIEGSRQAHLRDGVAVTRFLAWFAREAPKGNLTEIDAALKLEECRFETGLLKQLSFPTIAGGGPHAAIPHYRVTTASNRKITPGISSRSTERPISGRHDGYHTDRRRRPPPLMK